MKTTRVELESLVARLNRVTSAAEEPYTKGPDGHYVPNPLNYHLSWAYGGVKLVQMGKTGSGTSNITSGYDTKTNCYKQVAAYLAGVESSKRSI